MKIGADKLLRALYRETTKVMVHDIYLWAAMVDFILRHVHHLPETQTFSTVFTSSL